MLQASSLLSARRVSASHLVLGEGGGGGEGPGFLEVGETLVVVAGAFEGFEEEGSGGGRGGGGAVAGVGGLVEGGTREEEGWGDEVEVGEEGVARAAAAGGEAAPSRGFDGFAHGVDAVRARW